MKTASETKPVCKHCGSPLPHGSGSADNDFCCGGCEAAWHTIHKLGLDDFYTRKAGIVTAKVGEQSSVLLEHFADCVTANKPSDGIDTAAFYITSVRCAACVWLVENLIRKMPGVQDIRVNYATFRTTVTYDPSIVSLNAILKQIASIGHPPAPTNPITSDTERKKLALRLGVGAFFSVQLMLYSFALYAGYFADMPPATKRIMQFISWALATPVLLYTGAPFIINSIRALRRLHMSMDVLVALGAVSAYLYSVSAIFLGYETYFDTCAMILTLISLGRYIELTSKQKARGNMLSLLALSPPIARVIQNDGSIATMSPAKVQEGWRLQVLAGDKIPVDGLVLSGSSEVDESMLTGEPIPKGKHTGSKVYAGTVNLSGVLELTAEAVQQTVLAQIIASIEAADASKTRLMQLVDKFVAVFVPAVIAIAAGCFVARYFIIDNSAAKALMHSVAVLVVACPCALGLAVPLAVTTAVGSAAAQGAVIKNADLLANLKQVAMICLDKTGTLTIGKPKVLRYKSNDARFLVYSASLEACSRHTLAVSIASCIQAHLPATAVQEEAGLGISGIVDGHRVRIGRYGYVAAKGIPKPEILNEEAANGCTIVCVGIDGNYVGYYALSDPLRDDVFTAVKRLRQHYGVALLSGDSDPMVSAAASHLGIGYRAELTPFDKLDILKSYQAEGHSVLMVGDGINDAPALKQANASIAVGRNIADIAVDSADAVLMRPDLTLLESLFKLAKRSDRIIKENLCWAFIYNIIALPLAVAGLIHPIASAICMSLSSVIVVLNSTRAKMIN
ncbi:MAG: heavy metal translocating P-type ATPase [Deferribacteraceae bacterium]|jgi:heavy metal translocating P-type ATPase|nr:heavy metal translocating P-type ATPase [Deferribacteraceae bacterium]